MDTVKSNSSKSFILCIILLMAGLAGSFDSAGQTQKRIIQLSGIVMDSVGLPGVHVYVPKAGRGTTTNGVGFFSMPVLAGDSIVISSVGYKRQHYIVPQHTNEYLTIVVTMVEDATYLSDVIITEFPTEEVFKEAILALNIPTHDQSIDQKNLNQELLALILKTTPMDGYQNQRYYMNQWASSQSDKFQPVTNPFLNPFNWAKFFNSLKKDKKK